MNLPLTQSSIRVKIRALNEEINSHQAKYLKERKDLRKKLAELIIKANEVDIGVAEISDIVNIKRQNLYALLKEVYGVRYPNMIRNKSGKNTENEQQGY